MTDRELLELAAKAAGIGLRLMEIKNVTEEGDDRLIGYMSSSEKCPRGWFNPLRDDGDALRLAVTLGVVPYVDVVDGNNMPATSAKAFRRKPCVELHGDDPLAATRRAIVRAAAEVGKAMK